MAPRKSVQRTKANEPSSQASSSKATLDAIPPPDVMETITPDYVPQPRARVVLEEADKDKMIHELAGFYPRGVCDEITSKARDGISDTIGRVENWANMQISEEEDAVQREINIGLYAAESLLESRVDKEFDKFTAWMLRNPFELRGDREYVLPWQAGLDFSRGEFITTLPQGQQTLESRLEELRAKTEQARYVSLRLAKAEAALDRRLEIAKQRKAEVGFVKEVLSSSGLSPLPETATAISQALLSLHNQMSPLEPHQPALDQPLPQGAKAWEMGRQAYLNWAVGKVLPANSAGGDEAIDGVEREMLAAEGSEGVDRLGEVV